MSAKIVIYTAIFGNYDGLIPQPEFPDIDYLCFTDKPVNCKPWRVVEVKSKFNDATLDARYHKILGHPVLEKYETSVYIDGNFLMLENPEKLIQEKLQGNKVLAYFDHNKADDARDCIYDEYEALLKLEEEKGYFKDDPKAMKNLIDFLKKENYPLRNGLISSGVLLRKHKDLELHNLMKAWWHFVKNYTKRDQLSFNYVLWKQDFDRYVLLEGDIRRGNPWFYFLGSHRKDYRIKLLKYKLKRLLRK